MATVDRDAENEAGADDASHRLGYVRRGLAPTRRIYRNYSWVIVIACLLISLWFCLTIKNKDSFIQKEYFDEAGTLDQYGATMMLAEQSKDLPAVERWLLDSEDPGDSARNAVEYLEYANGKDLLTYDGKVTLACLHWSLGNDSVASAIVEPIGNEDSLYAEALKELMAGRQIDDYTWEAFDDQLRTAPRAWVACFLAEKAAELRQDDEAEAMKNLVHERRQTLLVTSAKVIIIDWLLFLTGAICLVVLMRRFMLHKQLRKRLVPRLPRLWPLSFIIVIFVLGDFLAEFVNVQMWRCYDVIPWEIPYLGFGVFADVVFRAFGTVLFLWFFFRRPRYVWKTLLRPVPKLWQWVLASFTLVWGIDLVLYSLPQAWFPFDPTIGYQWNEYGWEGLLTSMVSAVILAPFFEEFVFRGLLFNGLKNRLGLHASAVISAVMFGAVHFYGVQDLLAVGLFGLVMAYVYHLTQSLWPCILCHALVNLLITLWRWLVLQSPVELWEIY